jgi:hypothetical protein
MKISAFQIGVICVIILISVISYFLTKPGSSTPPPPPTIDSTSAAKKIFFDDTTKNILAMSNGYRVNKENIFNAIDTAFKEDALKICKCYVDFIKQYSDKKDSDIILFNQQDYLNAFMSIVFKNPGVSPPLCNSSTRQLDFLQRFLVEGRCYPNINELISWIKNNISNNYDTTRENNNQIVLSPLESDKYTVFLTSHSCCKDVSLSLQCGTQCFNPNTDVANCGFCGNACPTGKICDNGKCK